MHWQLEVHQTPHPAQKDPEMKTAGSWESIKLCTPLPRFLHSSYTSACGHYCYWLSPKKTPYLLPKTVQEREEKLKKKKSESLQGKRYKQRTGEENGKVQCSVRASTGLLELAQVCSAL